MITRDRMAAVDRNAEWLGVPRGQLMESSGNAIAREVRDVADPGASVGIVCGRGDNGGDGFVAARFLDEYDVSVRLLGRPDAITTEIARANWEALESSEYELETFGDSRDVNLPDWDLIVDAMVGTGVTGALREPAATVADAVNEHAATVISVDVPSGMNADTGTAEGASVSPDRVVTFHDVKPGVAELAVPVTIADIGIPPAAERFVGPGDLGLLDRDPESHKGDAGRIVVIGGGPYTGAPALSALAALRTGADLGVVVCPEQVGATIQSYTPDLIVQPVRGDRIVSEHVDSLLERAADADCVVLGPGLGEADETANAVAAFLSRFDGTCVVDADALLVVPQVDTDATLVCTPHQGELVEMGGPHESDWEDRAVAVEAFSRDLGHTLVVKGRYDVSSDGERTRINRTGNPGMTVGGTGDVLAGAIAALLATDRDPLEAGAVGTFVNGAAGDVAEDAAGHGLTASDVVEELPGVLWGDTDE